MKYAVHLVGILGLLLVIPLLRGGNTEFARAVLIAVIVACAWVGILLPNSQPDSVVNNKPWRLVWWVFSAWMLAQLAIQLLINPGGITPDSRFGIFMPLEALVYWALFTVYWMIAWMISHQPIKSVKLVVIIIICLAALQAMYGLVSFVGKSETIFGYWERAYMYDASGSFMNRNHFADYLALALPISLSFFYSKNSLLVFDKHPLFKHGLAVIFVTVLFMAILGSHSRLGMFVALIAIILWAYFYLVRPSGNKKRSLLPVSGVAALVLFGMIWFGASGLLVRLLETDTELGPRGEAWLTMLNMPLSTWLFGVGAGSFKDAFGTIVTWNVQDPAYHEAHNDVLEYVFDFGLIGTILMVGALIYWYYRLKVVGWSLIQCGGFCGVLATTVHSLGDFSLQIPGVAVLFWVLVGIIMNPNVSQAAVNEARKQARRAKRRRHDDVNRG